MLQFWKENAEKFEEKDFQILRVLLKLLEASRETRTLAVGCHDLGMFITHHPHGRSIVTGTLCAEYLFNNYQLGRRSRWNEHLVSASFCIDSLYC